MGNIFCRCCMEEIRVLICGLDDAGKTTILYKLKLPGVALTTIPTLGYNFEMLQYKNINVKVWDVGGLNKIRPLWRHYCQNADAVIFVVDSNDRERIGEIKEEMKRILDEDELRECAVAVLANKQDLPSALSTEEVSNLLEIRSFCRNHACDIFSTSGWTGEGLNDLMDWLALQVTNRHSSSFVSKD